MSNAGTRFSNFNIDTIAGWLENALTRIENLEKVVVPLVGGFSPTAGAIGVAAEGATEAAGVLVSDVQEGVDSATGTAQPPRQPAPTPPQRQPQPTAPAQQAQPTAKPSAADLIAAKANGNG